MAPTKAERRTAAEKALIEAALVLANYHRVGHTPRLDLPLAKAFIAAAEALATERGMDLADLVEPLCPNFPGSVAVRPIRPHPSEPIVGPARPKQHPNDRFR
jgi:hypothetical protein